MHRLILLALIPLIAGQYPDLLDCPEVEPVKNFRKNDFTGRWYLIQSYPNMYEKHYKCIYGDYSFPEDGIFHQYYDLTKTSDNTQFDLNVTGTFLKDDTVAQFEYDAKETLGDVHFPLNVIDTDYVNYLVYWGCEQREHYSASYSWIYARNRTLSQEYLDKALEAYKRNGLDTEILRKRDQSNCPN